MKHLLLWLLAVAAPTLALAQGRDSALAVHKLFQQKRRRGAAWVGAGAEVAFDHTLGYRATAGANAAQAAVFGGVPLVVGLLQVGRYSAGREAQVLEAYRQGQPLPPDVRRRLRRRHFRRTAHDVLLP